MLRIQIIVQYVLDEIRNARSEFGFVIAGSTWPTPLVGCDGASHSSPFCLCLSVLFPLDSGTPHELLGYLNQVNRADRASTSSRKVRCCSTGNFSLIEKERKTRAWPPANCKASQLRAQPSRLEETRMDSPSPLDVLARKGEEQRGRKANSIAQSIINGLIPKRVSLYQ